MKPETRGSLSSRPMLALSLALGATALALVCLAWNAFRFMREFEDLEQSELRIEQLRGKIVHLDEVLTMSARMGAATGDPQWEVRYRKFEPELAEAIREALSLSPKTVAVETVARTDAANSALVQMENSAFDLIHRHQLEAAQATLFSAEYDRQKRIYAAGMNDLDSTLKQSVRRDVKAGVRNGQILLVILAIALPLLLGFWIIVLRTLTRWKAALMRHDEQLSRQSAEMAQLNADLDRKVAERTSELERSREEALHHLEEAQQARVEIARFAQKLELILDCAGEGIFSLDLEDKATGVNPSAARMLGWEADELKGRVMHSVIHHTKADGTPYPHEECPIHAATRQGTSYRLKNEVFWRKDGTSFPVEYTSAPICSGDGHPEGVVVIFRDVTERKRAEAQILLQAAALESAANAIVIADRDGCITWVNPSFTRLTGFTPEEAIGQNPRILKSGQHDVAFYQQMWQTLVSGSAWRGEIINKRKDGTLYNEEMTITPVSSEGKIQHFVAIKQDVTGRIRTLKDLAAAREAAEAANRAKSEFLANMSHEIRTPMNGIIGMTELALDTELTRDQREFLTLVKTSADSLLTVINDILDLSKIEAGKLDLDAIEFDLRDNLSDTLKPLAVRAGEKGLELTYEIQPDVPAAIVGDPGRVRQIIANLVGNAIKFTESGEVKVQVRTKTRSQDAVELQFSVADTGIGISEEKRKLIFEPFVQADGSITRKYGGTGLGLSISAILVEMMGGKIWVEGDLGQGSTFHFTTRFAMPQAQHVQLSKAPPNDLKGLRVLVVDDNATNRRILQEMLTNWGMNPQLAESARTALSAMHQASEKGHVFPLILLDAQMPDMDGFALAEQIKKDPKLARATIMMLTSGGQRGDASRCRELGIAAYLMKPIKQSELRAALFSVLVQPVSETEPRPLVTRHTLRKAEKSLRILLAEDNRVNQRLAVLLLEKRGHQVVVTGNGKEAVAALAKDAFDIVLMDMQMPEMDGFEATAAIRKKEMSTGQHIPIVALTACALKGDRERCLAAGMDGYVSKPIKAEELFEAMAPLLTHSFASSPSGLDYPMSAVPEEHETVFDRAALEQTVGGDLLLLEELADLYSQDYPPLLALLRHALAQHDSQQAIFAAHSLRGMAGNFSAREAQKLAQQIELGAESGRVDLIPLCDQLGNELDRVDQALQRVCKGVPQLSS